MRSIGVWTIFLLVVLGRNGVICASRRSSSLSNEKAEPRSLFPLRTSSLIQRPCTCASTTSCSCCETVKIFYTRDERRLCFNMIYQMNGLNLEIVLDSLVVKAMTVSAYRPFQMCATVPGLFFSSICVSILEINQFPRSITVCPRFEVNTKTDRWQITYVCSSISTILPGQPTAGAMMPTSMVAAMMGAMMPGMAAAMMPGAARPGMPTATMGTMMPGMPAAMMPGAMMPGAARPGVPGAMGAMMPGGAAPGMPAAMMPGGVRPAMPAAMGAMMPGGARPGMPAAMMPGGARPGMPAAMGAMMPGGAGSGMPAAMVPGGARPGMPAAMGAMMPGGAGSATPAAMGAMMPGGARPGMPAAMMPGGARPGMPAAMGAMMPGGTRPGMPAAMGAMMPGGARPGMPAAMGAMVPGGPGPGMPVVMPRATTATMTQSARMPEANPTMRPPEMTSETMPEAISDMMPGPTPAIMRPPGMIPGAMHGGMDTMPPRTDPHPLGGQEFIPVLLETFPGNLNPTNSQKAENVQLQLVFGSEEPQNGQSNYVLENLEQQPMTKDIAEPMMVEDTTELTMIAETQKLENLKRKKRNPDIFEMYHQSNRCERAYRICVTKSRNYIVSRMRNSKRYDIKKNNDCVNKPARIVYEFEESECPSGNVNKEDHESEEINAPHEAFEVPISQNNDSLSAIIVHDESGEGSDYYPQNNPYSIPISLALSRPEIFPMRTPPFIALQIKKLQNISSLTNEGIENLHELFNQG